MTSCHHTERKVKLSSLASRLYHSLKELYAFYLFDYFIYLLIFWSIFYCPIWHGSVDWTPGCEAKGGWFDSQSGHMPRLQARSPIGGAQEAATHWCFSLSLSPSLSLSLKINKYNLLKNIFFDYAITVVPLFFLPFIPLHPEPLHPPGLPSALVHVRGLYI